MVELIRRVFANPWLLWALLTVLGATSAFIVLGRADSSWPRIAVGAVFGFAVGAAYLVEVRLPASAARSRLVCGAIGLSAGVAISWLLAGSMQFTALAAGAGLLLGFFSRNWIRHVNLP